MKNCIRLALAIIAFSAQLQMPACAQSADQLPPPQLPSDQLQTQDAALRGPFTTPGQPAPFLQSPQSTPFSMPQGNGGNFPAPSGSAGTGSPMAPFSTSSKHLGKFKSQKANAKAQKANAKAQMANYKAQNSNYKAQKSHFKHHGGGFSPVDAVVGVPDRAAKTGLGVTGKTTKELFKAIF